MSIPPRVDTYDLNIAKSGAEYLSLNAQKERARTVNACIARLEYLENATDNPAVLARVTDLERDKAELTGALNNKDATLSQLERDKADLQEQLDSLQHEYDKVSSSVDSSNMSADAENAEVKRLTAENMRLIGEVAHFKSECESWRVEVLKFTGREFYEMMKKLGFADTQPIDFRAASKRVDMLVQAAHHPSTTGQPGDIIEILAMIANKLGFSNGRITTVGAVFEALDKMIAQHGAMQRTISDVARVLGFGSDQVTRTALLTEIKTLQDSFSEAFTACDRLREILEISDDDMSYEKLIEVITKMNGESKDIEGFFTDVQYLIGSYFDGPGRYRGLASRIRDIVNDARQDRRMADIVAASIELSGDARYVELYAEIDRLKTTMQEMRRTYRINEKTMNEHTANLMARLKDREERSRMDFAGVQHENRLLQDEIRHLKMALEDMHYGFSAVKPTGMIPISELIRWIRDNQENQN
jgi:chromosome segregation ATPase